MRLFVGLLITADVREGRGCHGAASRKTVPHLDMICSSFQMFPSNPNALAYMTRNQECVHLQVHCGYHVHENIGVLGELQVGSSHLLLDISSC